MGHDQEIVRSNVHTMTEDGQIIIELDTDAILILPPSQLDLALKLRKLRIYKRNNSTQSWDYDRRKHAVDLLAMKEDRPTVTIEDVTIFHGTHEQLRKLQEDCDDAFNQAQALADTLNDDQQQVEAAR